MHPSPSIQLKQTTNNKQQIHTASQHTKNHYVLNTKSPLQQWEWRADPVSKWRSAGTMNASFPNGFLRPKQSLRLHLAMTHHASRCQQVMVVVNPLHHFQRILLSLLSAVLYELDKKQRYNKHACLQTSFAWITQQKIYGRTFLQLRSRTDYQCIPE